MKTKKLFTLFIAFALSISIIAGLCSCGSSCHLTGGYNQTTDTVKACVECDKVSNVLKNAIEKGNSKLPSWIKIK